MDSLPEHIILVDAESDAIKVEKRKRIPAVTVELSTDEEDGALPLEEKKARVMVVAK